jgi:hypothetical protein
MILILVLVLVLVLILVLGRWILVLVLVLVLVRPLILVLVLVWSPSPGCWGICPLLRGSPAGESEEKMAHIPRAEDDDRRCRRSGRRPLVAVC